MTATVWAFLIGCIVGGTFGVLVMAVVFVGRDDGVY